MNLIMSQYWTGMKTSLENKHLGNSGYFVIITFSSRPLLLTKLAAKKLTGRSAVEGNIENERFTVII